MSQELQVRFDLGNIEKVLVSGDLKGLTEQQRVNYYNQVCQSLGLNPLTRPLDYLVLNGKLQLYANKNCAEQLRKVYGVSIVEMTQQVQEGIVTTIVKGRDSEGREDMASASVVLTGLKGEGLANAFMKAETKAKRRLTLSICGLGMLDETEVESIPGARRVESPDMAPPATSQLEAPAEAPAKAKASPFGVMIGDVAKKAGIGLETFINRLFADLVQFHPELESVAESGWKDKGAALSALYQSASAEDKEGIEMAIGLVPGLLRDEANAQEVPA